MPYKCHTCKRTLKFKELGKIIKPPKHWKDRPVKFNYGEKVILCRECQRKTRRFPRGFKKSKIDANWRINEQKAGVDLR